MSLVFDGASDAPGSAEVRSPLMTGNPICILSTVTSGVPHDELPYVVTIDDSNVSGLNPGDYEVMVRFEDPEEASTDSQAVHQGFEPNQGANPPVPDPDYRLHAVTYQAFTIRLLDSCPEITAVAHNASNNPPLPGDTATWTATTSPGSPTIGTYWQYLWLFGKGTDLIQSTSVNPVVEFTNPGIHNVRLAIVVRQIGTDDILCITPQFETTYEVDCYPEPTWSTNLVLYGCSPTSPPAFAQRTSITLLPAGAGGGQGGMAAVVFNDHRTNATCSPSDHFDLSLILVNPSTGALVSPPSPGDTVFGLDGHPNPSGGGTEPRDGAIRVGDTSLVAFEGGLAVVYLVETVETSPAHEIRLTFSPFPLEAIDPSDPTDNAGWLEPLVVEGDAVNNTYNSAVSRCHGDVIAISYQAQDQDSWVAEVLLDGGSTVTKHEVEASGDVGDQSSLIEYRGRLALTYLATSGGAIRYARALSPDVGSPWGSPMTIASGGSAAGDTALVELDGRLVAVYRTNTGGSDPQDVAISFALLQEPLDSGDWNTPYIIDTGSGGSAIEGLGYELKAVVADGRLALAYRDGTNNAVKMARACMSNPASGSDWQISTLSTSVYAIGVDLGLATSGSTSFYVAYGGPNYFTGYDELRFVRNASDPW